MVKQPVGDDSVGRMQFLLAMRRRGIGDAAVLRALDEVPREHFVGHEFQGAAYADQALPIACGQTISQPYVVAYMTEQLGVRPQHKVLEIGTGSGYQAAILSRLAHEVVSIERYRTLADAARARMETLGYQNVEIRIGDGLAGASGPGAVRPHHRDGGGRDRAGRARGAARGRWRDVAAAGAAWRGRSAL